MNTLEPSLLVVLKIFVKITTRVQRTKLEDGFSRFQSPSCTGDVHAVFDEMATRLLRLHRGNGESIRKVLVVAHHVCVFEQVNRAVIGGGAFLF